MNKVDAKEIAMINEKTWAELKAMVVNSDKNGTSKVNPTLKKSVVADIFMNMFKNKDLEKVPVTTYFHPMKNRLQLNGDGIGIVNLLREFG